MSDNAVKITYIICHMIIFIFLACLAVAAPIWLTPDTYWWTAFSLTMTFVISNGFGKRLNTWEGFGFVKFID